MASHSGLACAISENMLPTFEQAGQDKPFDMTPFMRFLHSQLDLLRPQLKERVEMTVALHKHPGVAGVMEAAEEVRAELLRLGAARLDVSAPTVRLEAGHVVSGDRRAAYPDLFRDRFGMYSEVRAIAFGIAPPMPNPVNTRNAINWKTDVAVAVSSAPTPNVSAHAMRTGLRPNRSANGPKMSAPIIIPTIPLEITGPRATRAI